jgi:hypothetical protein
MKYEIGDFIVDCNYISNISYIGELIVGYDEDKDYYYKTISFFKDRTANMFGSEYSDIVSRENALLITNGFKEGEEHG